MKKPFWTKAELEADEKEDEKNVGLAASGLGCVADGCFVWFLSVFWLPPLIWFMS